METKTDELQGDEQLEAEKRAILDAQGQQPYDGTRKGPMAESNLPLPSGIPTDDLHYNAPVEYATQPSKPPMPRYQCHKVVQALEANVVRVPTPDPGTRIVLQPVDTRFERIVPSQQWLDRHQPTGRGYYVVYPDGYVSWSPAEAFESGYTPMQCEGAAEDDGGQQGTE